MSDYYLNSFLIIISILLTAEERRIQVTEIQAASNALTQRTPSPDNNLTVPRKIEHHRPRLHSRFK